MDSEYDKLFPPPTVSSQSNDTAAPSTSKKARQDFATELYEACIDPEASADVAMSSKHSTWLATLRGAIQNTSKTDVPVDEWTSGFATAMATAGIEWVPGCHRKRLTSQRIVRLVGQKPTKPFLLAPVGSLKRAAMEAEIQMAAEEEEPKKTRKREIHFGYRIPFDEVPSLVMEGFQKLERTFQNGDQGVLNHYRAARNCLVSYLGKPSCDLMLILALTIASSTATPQVAPKKTCFSVASKRKDPAMLAANMVTRMLWFLERDSFPWKENKHGVLRVSEMTKKMGKYLSGRH